MNHFKSLLFLFFFSLPVLAADKELTVDKAHTEIGFKVKHLMIANVKGNFKEFEGSAHMDDKSGKVTGITIKMNAASINTNEPDRDKHLRSADFFETNKYPNVTFTSDGAIFKKGKETVLKGKLTIKNVTKEITLRVIFNGSNTDPWGNVHYAFEAEGKINRKDFGLNWNKSLDSGGVVVSDEVVLSIESQFIAK